MRSYWRSLTRHSTFLCVLVTVLVFLGINHHHHSPAATRTVRHERGVAPRDGLSRVGGADTVQMGVADDGGNGNEVAGQEPESAAGGDAGDGEKSGRHDRWIILTSIAPPTEDVKFLAQLPGWKLLVVGDTKTPQDWSYPGVVYLSVATQESLGYRSTQLLPYRSYTRKNVGYLYAIQHGAKVIYETDDDNRPTDQLRSFILTKTTHGLMFAGPKLFNPYKHFGQSTLWPRGYPLGGVGLAQTSDYRVGSMWPTPLIQQGVVNGDPDMDAIFRLTRKKTQTPLDVHFDPAAPPVFLPEGVFSPFNSQNTLFHYNAFPLLLLPTTTSFRMCDIWRGYWAQRLLWEIGGQLSFFPPNAYQFRNAHSYMADAEDEKVMYYDTERLLDFLRDWLCPQEFTFFQCVHKLSADMAKANFWFADDAQLALTWIEDLRNIGFIEPQRVGMVDVSLKSGVNMSTSLELDAKRSITIQKGSYVNFVAVEQPPPNIDSKYQCDETNNVVSRITQIMEFCSKIDNYTVDTSRALNNYHDNTIYHDILLIIVFNFPGWYNTSIPYLEVMHRYAFPNIVYCGENSTDFMESANKLDVQITFIEAPVNEGFQGYMCLTRAMDMSFNVSGYLVVGDDNVINYWNFKHMDKTKFWRDKDGRFFNCTEGPTFLWLWWKETNLALKTSLQDLDTNGPKELTEMYFKNLDKNGGFGKETCRNGISDVYYVPARATAEVNFLMAHFARHKVFVELAVPMTMYGVATESEIDYIAGTNLWQWHRELIWTTFYNQTKHYMHPVKFSNSSHREPFCKQYLTRLVLDN